ncbi:hypothetical protein [Methylocystis heyeri]|uniref:Uncharacterized protein n=1 Tax=Methylocystis heyeri TaxID=391905 RepID=A0A6B8KCM8_9HYPH|nr:hypothetical protein [Methylocystis heyeri]QGM45986.1 hypothetical protein H2LOC_009885 [Methylocystis heyeri]
MTDLEAILLVGAPECFRAKWIPVRVKKTRLNKTLSTLIAFTIAPSTIIYLIAFMVLVPVLGALLFAAGGFLLDAALSICDRRRARRSVQTTLDEIGETESN